MAGNDPWAAAAQEQEENEDRIIADKMNALSTKENGRNSDRSFGGEKKQGQFKFSNNLGFANNLKVSSDSSSFGGGQKNETKTGFNASFGSFAGSATSGGFDKSNQQSGSSFGGFGDSNQQGGSGGVPRPLADRSGGKNQFGSFGSFQSNGSAQRYTAGEDKATGDIGGFSANKDNLGKSGDDFRKNFGNQSGGSTTGFVNFGQQRCNRWEHDDRTNGDENLKNSTPFSTPQQWKQQSNGGNRDDFGGNKAWSESFGGPHQKPGVSNETEDWASSPLQRSDNTGSFVSTPEQKAANARQTERGGSPGTNRGLFGSSAKSPAGSFGDPRQQGMVTGAAGTEDEGWDSPRGKGDPAAKQTDEWGASPLVKGQTGSNSVGKTVDGWNEPSTFQKKETNDTAARSFGVIGGIGRGKVVDQQQNRVPGSGFPSQNYGSSSGFQQNSTPQPQRSFGLEERKPGGGGWSSSDGEKTSQENENNPSSPGAEKVTQEEPPDRFDQKSNDSAPTQGVEGATNTDGAAGYEEIENKAESSLLNKIVHNKLVEVREADVKIKIENLQENPQSPLFSVKTFDELHLSDELIKGVADMGFNQPSKIQESALPVLVAEPPQNMIAQSQSGTGKTAAFVLTMLMRVDPSEKYPQCLCLAPTYELALQIGQVVERMGKYLPEVKVAYAVRGQRVQRGRTVQEQIVIGTPGTTLDWVLKMRAFDPRKIRVFVLDEADVMISQQGHQDQSIRIEKTMSERCQRLLFSATYDDEVMEFAEKIVSNPVVITVRREEQTLDNIRQYYVRCQSRVQKYGALANLYGSLTIGQCMVFCATRKSASWLAGQLSKDGHMVGMLSGEMDISQRADVIRRFKDGNEKVLITTNVSARGIDVQQVSIVINYDMPITPTRSPDFETYLHRIGRTGRFGKSGIAINFVDSEWSLDILMQIQDHFGKEILLLDTENPDELERIEDRN